MTNITNYLRKWILICSMLLFIVPNVEAGWCEWFNCGTECEQKLEQAERDKIWLWDELVKCRKKLPPKPFPQPTTFKTVSSDEILKIFRDAGADGFQFKYGDLEYKTISKLEFESWLKYNPISEEQYIHPGMDCEDFAQHTVVAARQWFPSIAISEVWATLKNNPDYNHAFIAFIDIENTLHFYEPQSDKWDEVENWNVYFVKFDIKEDTND